MRKPRAGSLTPEIIRLAQEGLSRREIARRVGCAHPNVYKTLVRFGVIAPTKPLPAVVTKISVLSDDDRIWLREEAKRMNVSWRDLARALLVDAINEVRDGRKG